MAEVLVFLAVQDEEEDVMAAFKGANKSQAPSVKVQDEARVSVNKTAASAVPAATAAVSPRRQQLRHIGG